MVSFLNLEYFLSVAQKRSFSKAAQDLCISQQALSIHIARLESEFGVLLFERSHPLSLTPAGEKLYFRVEKMLCLKVEIEQEMHEYLQQDREVINLGVSYEYARTILPQVLPDVCKRYPQVKINLLEDNPKELDLALTEGHIDLILSTTPFFGNNITVERLYSNDISLVVPDQVLSQVFGDQADEVRQKLYDNFDLRLLKDCPFILQNTNNRLPLLANKLFQNYDFKPNILLKTETLQTAFSLCQHGLGIIFLPDLHKQEYLHKLETGYYSYSTLNIYPVPNAEHYETIAFCHLKAKEFGPALTYFMQLTRERLSSDDFFSYGPNDMSKNDHIIKIGK